MKGVSRSFGTSKGCRQCRAKRKKCDGLNPCSRCKTSHTSCSGPVDGILIVNRSSHDFKECTQRVALKNALMGRRHREDTAPAVFSKTTPFLHQGSSRHFAIASDAGLDKFPVRSVYACLLDDFRHTVLATSGGQDSSSGVLGLSTIMLCMRLVVGMGSASETRPKFLDAGVFSLLSLYFGKKFPAHHRLIDLSRRSYSLTVKALYGIIPKLGSFDSIQSAQKKQQRQRHAHAHDAFYLSLVLTLFELVDEPFAVTALDIHIDGTLHILQQIGPERISDCFIPKELLLGFRSIAYASAVRRRSSLFFDEPQWLNVFSGGSQGDNLEHLHNIAVRLPRLLARTNNLMSPNMDGSKDNNLSLLLDYTTLKSMFQNWYLQRLSYNEAVGDLHTNRPKLRKRVKPETEFESMPHLSTMLIELDMGFSDLLFSSKQHPSFENIRKTYDDYEIIDTKRLLTTTSESIQSLCDSNEGKLVAAIPLDTLKRYQAHLQVRQKRLPIT